jgi:hypothetical protein
MAGFQKREMEAERSIIKRSRQKTKDKRQKTKDKSKKTKGEEHLKQVPIMK